MVIVEVVVLASHLHADCVSAGWAIDTVTVVVTVSGVLNGQSPPFGGGTGGEPAQEPSRTWNLGVWA